MHETDNLLNVDNTQLWVWCSTGSPVPHRPHGTTGIRYR